MNAGRLGTPPPVAAEAFSGPVRHLYVHVPFCRARCDYCDYVSVPLGDSPDGAILDRFYCEYAGFNHFTQTVIRSVDRGEIMRWPVRTGLRRPL